MQRHDRRLPRFPYRRGNRAGNRRDRAASLDRYAENRLRGWDFTRRDLARWAAVATGAAVTADFPDFQVPQAHADAIATTGAPLLTLATLVDSQTGKVITAGNVFPGPGKPISQIGYEIQVQVTANSASTVPYAVVALTWVDSGTGITVGSDTWTVPGSSNATPFMVLGKGPSKADKVSVTVTNLDPANSITISYVLIQNSRVYPKDDWRWYNNNNRLTAVPAATLPTLPPDESVLGLVDNVTILASSQDTFLFGMYNGPVTVSYELSSGSAASLMFRVRPQPDSAYSGHNILGAFSNPSPSFQVAGPRAPLRVVVANSATTTITLSFALTAVIS
jgi:hypothetical protein